jgi:hypothetical protein
MKNLVVTYFANASLRHGALLLAVVLGPLVAGAWATVDLTAERIWNRDARDTATEWANFLAANVTDLEQIAAGKQPSKQSLAFLDAAHKTGDVFRHVIYDRAGYSLLVSDARGVSFVEIPVLSREAEAAVVSGVPLVATKSAGSIRVGQRRKRGHRGAARIRPGAASA